MNPYRIEGPACISFSGGRTSGYMLHQILQAWDGVLPEDVVVLFANTGKEMPETLDFVQECSDRWSVPITWLEYRDAEEPKDRWQVVTHATASRNGEPFRALVGRKNYLPNPVTRFCTVEMKLKVASRYLMATYEWGHWTSAVGFRADEPARVAKLSAPSDEPYDRVAPLAQAGITKADVGRFWSANDFDLGLPAVNGVAMHGNCDLCFLKGADQILSLIREQPSRAIWWMEQEGRLIGKAKAAAATFRSDRPSYREMHRMATQHGEMFEFEDIGLEDCACTD